MPDNTEELLRKGVLEARQQRAQDKTELDLYKLQAARDIYMDNFVAQVNKTQAGLLNRKNDREQDSAFKKFGQNFYKNSILYYLLEELQYGERLLKVKEEKHSRKHRLTADPADLHLDFTNGELFMASLHKLFNSYFQEQYDLIRREMSPIKRVIVNLTNQRKKAKNDPLLHEQLSKEINANIEKLANCENKVRALRAKESKLRGLIRVISIENGYAFAADGEGIRPISEAISLDLGQKAFQDHMAAFILEQMAEDGRRLLHPSFSERLSHKLGHKRILPDSIEEIEHRAQYYSLLEEAKKLQPGQIDKALEKKIKTFEDRLTSSVRAFFKAGNVANNFEAIRELKLPREALIAIRKEIEIAARKHEVDFPNTAISAINEEINNKRKFSKRVLHEEILNTLAHFEDDKKRARSITTTRFVNTNGNDHLHEIIATALQTPDKVEFEVVDEAKGKLAGEESFDIELEEYRTLSNRSEGSETSGDESNNSEMTENIPLISKALDENKTVKVRYMTLGAMMISALNDYKKRIEQIGKAKNKDFYDAQVELVKDLSAIIANLKAGEAQNYLKKQLSLFADLNGLPKFLFNINKLAKNRQDQQLVSDVSEEFVKGVKATRESVDAPKPFEEKYVLLEDRINVTTQEKLDKYHTKLTINFISQQLSLILGFTEGLVAYNLMPFSNFIIKLIGGISGAIVNFTLFDDYISSTMKGLMVNKWDEDQYGIPLSRKQKSLTLGVGGFAIFAGLGYGLLAFNSALDKLTGLAKDTFNPFSKLKIVHATASLIYFASFLAVVEFIGMTSIFYLGIADFIKENKLPEIVHTLKYAVTSFFDDLNRNWAYQDKHGVSPLKVGKFLLYSAVKTAFFGASLVITGAMSIVYPLFFGGLMITTMKTYPMNNFFSKILTARQMSHISKGLMYGPAAIVNNFFMGRGIIVIFNLLADKICNYFGLSNYENIPNSNTKNQNIIKKYEPTRFDLPSDKSARKYNSILNFAYKIVGTIIAGPNSIGQAGGPWLMVKNYFIGFSAFVSSLLPNLDSLLKVISGIDKDTLMRQPITEQTVPQNSIGESTAEINNGLTKRTIATMGTKRMVRIATNTIKFQEPTDLSKARNGVFAESNMRELKTIEPSSDDLIRRKRSNRSG